MLLATSVAQHVVRTCCGSREASVGTFIRCNFIPLGWWRRMALFTPIIGAVAFGWRRPTTARVFPPLTKLEDTFFKLLDINDVLILQRSWLWDLVDYHLWVNHSSGCHGTFRAIEHLNRVQPHSSPLPNLPKTQIHSKQFDKWQLTIEIISSSVRSDDEVFFQGLKISTISVKRTV